MKIHASDGSDMVAVPIASTAQVIPFRSGGSRSMRMFAEIRNPDGTPYAADPRVVLQRNLARLKDHGFSHMNIGPEAEFFYFKDASGPEILDHAGYFDINPVDIGDDIREVTVFALEAMGIPVEYHHSEVGPSQHEIEVRGEGDRTSVWRVRDVHAQAPAGGKWQRHAHAPVDLQG